MSLREERGHQRQSEEAKGVFNEYSFREKEEDPWPSLEGLVIHVVVLLLTLPLVNMHDDGHLVSYSKVTGLMDGRL